MMDAWGGRVGRKLRASARHTNAPAEAEAGESEKALTGESQGYSVRPPGLEPGTH